MNDILEAIEYFESDADERYVAKARELVEAGAAEWINDPDYERVVGLVPKYDHQHGYVIVYLRGSLVAAGGHPDFECSDAMDALVHDR